MASILARSIPRSAGQTVNLLISACHCISRTFLCSVSPLKTISARNFALRHVSAGDFECVTVACSLQVAPLPERPPRTEQQQTFIRAARFCLVVGIVVMGPLRLIYQLNKEEEEELKANPPLEVKFAPRRTPSSW